MQQAARDFENLAAVQKLFDDLTAADAAVRDFLTHYTAYLRAHVNKLSESPPPGLGPSRCQRRSGSTPSSTRDLSGSSATSTGLSEEPPVSES